MKKTLLLLVALSAINLAKAQLPEMIKDINPGMGESSWPHFTHNFLNDKVFFLANDGSADYEPFVSDGTAAGTFMLKDIHPTGSSYPRPGIVFNNLYYFTADDGTNGQELWVTDGTTAGTNMFIDLRAGGGSSEPMDFCVFDGKLYFTADSNANGRDLWVTDGTVSGTQLVAESYISIWGGLSVLNDQIIFSAKDTAAGTWGMELWATDGTTAGTYMLKDIYPGPDGGNPQYFTKMGNKLYFSAATQQDGTELWSTDGTTAGTTLVKDIGTGSTMPQNLFAHNNTLYFSANVDTSGRELWMSDGTAAGTVMLANILPGNSSSEPRGFFLYNSKVYFSANDSIHGAELWVTDGTTVGTAMVKDLFPGTSSGVNWSVSAVYHDRMYFYARDGVSGLEVWSSDGTDTGTHLLQDINPGVDDIWCGEWIGMVVANDILFFPGGDDATGGELYKLEITNTSVVEKVKTTEVVIYPNPAANEVHISNLKGADGIRVVDMTGRIVLNTKTSADKVTINISGLANGIYMVQLLNKGSVLETKKLTITK